LTDDQPGFDRDQSLILRDFLALNQSRQDIDGLGSELIVALIDGCQFRCACRGDFDVVESGDSDVVRDADASIGEGLDDLDSPEIVAGDDCVDFAGLQFRVDDAFDVGSYPFGLVDVFRYFGGPDGRIVHDAMALAGGTETHDATAGLTGEILIDKEDHAASAAFNKMVNELFHAVGQINIDAEGVGQGGLFLAFDDMGLRQSFDDALGELAEPMHEDDALDASAEHFIEASEQVGGEVAVFTVQVTDHESIAASVGLAIDSAESFVVDGVSVCADECGEGSGAYAGELSRDEVGSIVEIAGGVANALGGGFAESGGFSAGAEQDVACDDAGDARFFGDIDKANAFGLWFSHRAGLPERSTRQLIVSRRHPSLRSVPACRQAGGM